MGTVLPEDTIAKTEDSTWVRLAREVPGGFAGIYLNDHGALVLALTQPEKKLAAIAALSPQLALPSGMNLRDAIVERVRWDFAQLYVWSRYVLPKIEGRVVIADLAEQHNRIEIGVLQRDTASVNADLKKLSLPIGLVSVEVGGPICLSDIVPAVRVWAKDAKTGESVTPGARLTIRSTDFTETSVGTANFPQGSLEAGVGKTGVFDVVVQQAGYSDWEQKNVTVRFDGCHPVTMEFTALLRRT